MAWKQEPGHHPSNLLNWLLVDTPSEAPCGAAAERPCKVAKWAKTARPSGLLVQTRQAPSGQL
jgi:hypothetical protein